MPGAPTPSSVPGAVRPVVMSSSSALSRTLRDTACSTTISPGTGHGVSAGSRDGLKPNRPQHDAGIRIEPPPSDACASGTMPAATAAAAPPLEPPGV